MISALISAGVFVAVPILGSLALGRSPVQAGRAGRIPLVVAVGITLWSVPLIASLILQAYRPEIIGALGWILVAAWLIVRRPGLPRFTTPRPHVMALVLGLAAAGVTYAAAPSDPLAGGRDMSVYANHAIYMVHHGRLDIPYPAGQGTGESLPEAWVGFSGVYSTQPTLTVQFGHVYPAWLAQTFAVAGYGGLLRLNAIFAVLSGLAFFAVARRWAPGHVAVLATLFLAFNAGQVWVVRNTLTETLTQLCVWTAFLLLLSDQQQRPRAAAAWAGVLLGMSALVRLDSLVILPLAIAGHTLVRLIRGRAAEDLHIPTFYLTALPAFGIAIGYYIGFSNPYLVGHITLVLPIAAAGVAAAAVAGLTLLPPVWIRVARLVTDTRFLASAAAVVTLLALFAYFIRPTLEPFATLPRPGPTPPRSHIEEAMQNLGLYVTPVALWMGMGAWLAMTIDAVHRRLPRRLPVLVIIGGFSALYFWNQSITPDHFWAIRRFVPIILPAAVLFAGVAGAYILARLPRGWRRAAFAVAVVLLVGHTVRIGYPVVIVAERSGVYAALGEFAAKLPPGESFLGPFGRKAMHTTGTALFMTFDQDLLPIAFDEEGGREEIIERMREATPERPIPIITNLDDPAVLRGEIIAELRHEFDQMSPTVSPVPQLVLRDDIGLIARWVTGVSTLDLEMGPRSHWLIEQSGFFSPEVIDDHEARWTDGNAELHVPIFDGAYPERLLIDLEWTGPLGASVVITFNRTLLFAGDLPAGEWQATFDIPPEAAAGDEEVAIGIRSSTFEPADVLEGSRDTRELGVQVRSIRLLAGP